LECKKKKLTPEHGLVFEEKMRFLKACLDAAIMAEMSRRNAMSAPDIIAFFEKSYNIRISPGTIYPVLYGMEKRGHIRILPYRMKRFYALTDSGRKLLENLQQSMNEMQSFILGLINK